MCARLPPPKGWISTRGWGSTGGGIHAKIVLIRVDGETWSVVGSLDGGEISHKINREVLMFNVQVVLPALPSCLRGIGNRATSAIAAPLLQ